MYPVLLRVPPQAVGYLLAGLVAVIVIWIIWDLRRHGARADLLADMLIPLVVFGLLFGIPFLQHRSVQLYSYGLMLMLALAAGIAWSVREAHRRCLPAEIILDLALAVVISGLVGAKLLFMLLNLGHYAKQPMDMVTEWQSGLSFHGGLAAGVIAGIWFARSRKLSFWLLADIVAPALALGYSIARIGCFLRGCCYGVATNLPWGLRFVEDLRDYDPAHWIWQPEAHHPTQLYASLSSLAIFFVLLWARDRFSARGQLFFLYLALYGVARGLIEILRRGDTAIAVLGPITQAQIASIVLVIVSVWAILRLGRSSTTNGQHPKPTRAR